MTARITNIICPTPHLPVVATRALASASRSVILELAYLVNHDDQWSRRVVDAITGTLFACGRNVATVAEAALEYPQGFRKAAMSVILRDELFRPDSAVENFDPEGLWRHTVGVALASEDLAQRLRIPGPDRAYTAGLLHDLGIAALARNAPRRLERILQEIPAKGDPIRTELMLHGTTHCQIAAGIAREWDLDESVIEAIEHHHQPQKAASDHLLLANVVALADVLMSPDRVEVYSAAPIDDVALDGLGLDGDDLREVALNTEADLSQLGGLLDLGA